MDLLIKDIDLSALPPEVASAIERLVEIAKRQEALIQELRQALHGKKSEKLSEEQAIVAPLVRATMAAASWSLRILRPPYLR